MEGVHLHLEWPKKDFYMGVDVVLEGSLGCFINTLSLFLFLNGATSNIMVVRLIISMLGLMSQLLWQGTIYPTAIEALKSLNFLGES